MKITKKMLSIPPHLSTAWKHVASLRVEEGFDEDFEEEERLLVVHLHDGTEVQVPGLSEEEIEAIFDAHAHYLEHGAEEASPGRHQGQGFGFQGLGDQVIGLPFRLGPGGIEGLGAALTHDSNQRSAPDLPAEILGKVAQIAQMLGSEAAEGLPEPEVGCNCFHCQIARAIQHSLGNLSEEGNEEEVADEELQFRSWDIRQSGENLYIVTDPLDRTRHYSVFLGEPVGCTCGEEHCEHIQAVLRS